MSKRVTSPVFVGRGSELSVLRAAFDSARSQGQFVLVGGDAGVGKSRLIAEALERWRADGGLTIVGGCLELSVTAGFAPLVEVLRAARRAIGVDDFDAIVAADAPSLRGLLRGTPPARAIGPEAVLSHSLALLDAIGELHPGFVVVMEDVHWADPSTRDLMAFLARTIPTTRTALVATYRSDDLHRRHPLRPLLGELSRRPEIEHLRLGGLSRSELTMMLAFVADSVPADHDVDEVFARSEGNPFFAEELVAAREGGPLPESVRDAMLLRIGRLPEEAQPVLREAAALGMDVAEDLLASATDRPQEVVSGALRDGLAHQLLVPHADGCSFRHALLREALYEDLLPGERQRLHQRVAETLEGQMLSSSAADGMRWALVAHHAHAAGDQARAFDASVRAGADAEAVGALADAVGHYERALALWARIADPVAAAGATRAELLIRASNAAHHAGNPERALAMLDEVLAEMDDTTSPEERSGALVRLGDARWAGGDEAGSAEALHAAVDVLAGRPASEARALALAALARHQMLIDRFADAEATSYEALDVATLAGSTTARLGALCALCFSATKLGRPDQGLAAATEAVRLAETVGTADELGRAHVMLVATLLADNRLADVLDAAADGLEHARRSGMLASDGVLLSASRAEALVRLGRWDEAADVLAGLVPNGSGPYGSMASVVAIRLARARGDRVAAVDQAAVAGSSPIPGQAGGDALVATARLAADEGRHDDADEGFDRAFELAASSDHLSLVAATGAAALEAVADPGGRARTGADREARGRPRPGRPAPRPPQPGGARRIGARHPGRRRVGSAPGSRAL